jgi:hypothetical protein
LPKIKSSAQIAQKWADVTPTRQAQYTEGIQNPREDWATKTAAAADAHKKGIMEALAQNRFAAGVNRAGTAHWQAKSLSKGPDRWAQGVSVSASDYEKGFSPFRDVIERTTLPPRGPKGDPGNIKRVAVMADALHKAKLSMAR